MWSRRVEGRTLTFRLVGVNDQNFVMRDEETGTWWQQVTGEALLGPLRGRRLTSVAWSEVNFGIWRSEQPHTDVLAAEEEHRERYVAADWDRRPAGTAVPASLRGPPVLEPRDLIVGLQVGDRTMAYPLARLTARSPVLDRVGGVPVIVAVAGDGRSVRAFDRRLDEQVLELYARVGQAPADADAELNGPATVGGPRFVDSGTGSVWDFAGRAVSGPLTGRQLMPLRVHLDYWFDWANHNPTTGVYRAGR